MLQRVRLQALVGNFSPKPFFFFSWKMPTYRNQHFQEPGSASMNCPTWKKCEKGWKLLNLFILSFSKQKKAIFLVKKRKRSNWNNTFLIDPNRTKIDFLVHKYLTFWLFIPIQHGKNISNTQFLMEQENHFPLSSVA